jgi:hypothetical protein
MIIAIAVVLTVPGTLTSVTSAMLHKPSSIPVIADAMNLFLALRCSMLLTPSYHEMEFEEGSRNRQADN